KVARVTIHVVSALGDSEANDPRGRVGQQAQRACGVVGREEVCDHGPDDARLVPRGAPLDDGVQAVLGNKGCGHALVCRRLIGGYSMGTTMTWNGTISPAR